MRLGEEADEFVELCEIFPEISNDFVLMLLSNFIVNQEDRHAKNFGIVDGCKFSPLYDNGSSFYFGELFLDNSFITNNVSRFKTTGKDYFQTLSRYIEWLGVKPALDIERVMDNFNNICVRYKEIFSHSRLQFMRNLIESRVGLCKEIMHY